MWRLVEAKSIRAPVRITGFVKNTVAKPLVEPAEVRARFQDEAPRDLYCEHVQADKIWSFRCANAENIPDEHRGEFGCRDVWTFTVLDADTKPVPCQFGSSANASGRRKSSFVRLVLSAAMALASGFASAGSQPSLIPFPEPDRGIVRPDDPIKGYQSVLAAASRVMESTMGFPPLEGALRLYPNQLSLAAGIIREGYDASYASQLAGAIRGIGTPGNILLNESALRGLSWPAKTALVAHELTHVAEYKLAEGRRSNLDQWLREGLAEWVAWQVMEHLRMGSRADRRQVAVANLRKARRQDQLPMFEELLTPRAWLALPDHQRPGLMYDEAFLATDLLIERHGLASTLEYFRLFGGSDDHLANFKQAFGENRWSFAQDFMAHLQRLLGP